MLTIPFKVSSNEYSVFVVLEDENLERMREYDPAEVTCNKLNMGSARIRDIIIGWGSADDCKHVLELCSMDKPQEALQYLSRGWKYRPDKGDRDGPYLSGRINPLDQKQ